MVRRTLSFLFATGILLAGLALAAGELVRAEGVRPLLFLGALVMIIAGGAWLLDGFVLPRTGHR